MRYHLFLNFVGKMVKIAQTFCLNLAVRRYMSTSVALHVKIKDYGYITVGQKLVMCFEE